jgi:hypothetical protein
MARRVDRGVSESARDPLAVNTPVIVLPGTDQQQGGVIVEDFGESAGQAVEIGGNRIAGAETTRTRPDDQHIGGVDDVDVAARLGDGSGRRYGAQS